MLCRFSKLALIVALSGFVAAVLLDPSDEMLHMKVPLLFLVLSLWATRVLFGSTEPCGPKIWVGVLLFALIIPGSAMIIALLGSSLPPGELHFQIIKGFAVILLIPVVFSERIDLIKHIMRWSFIVAAFTLVLAVLSLVDPLFCAAVYGFANHAENVFTHVSLGFGVGSFYYKTVALLVFPIAYHLQNLLNRPKKLNSCLLMVIFTAGALFSGSRGIAIGVFIVVVALGFKKFKAQFGLGVALPVLFIILVAPAGYFASFFHPGNSSNSIKLGHIRSYAVLFEDHPTYLLWGQGTDTEFYSQGFQAKTALTELTYLELIRWFGAPITVLILAALLYPVFELARRANGESYLVIPYIAYLWEAATNPLLICSFGALLVSAIWGVVLMHSVKQSVQVPRRSPVD
jgi:hypothetical protein